MLQVSGFLVSDDLGELRVQLPRTVLWAKSPIMSNENRLFVGNLSFRTLEADLNDHFSAAGVVTSCNIMLDKFTGKSRGFAFVEFGSAEEAKKAVEMFHGKELQGRQLTVNIARPREERGDRPPRSGGRGDER